MRATPLSFLTAFLLLAGSAVPRPANATKPTVPAHEGRKAATDASHASVLPFVHDDYARALALAKERKVPLFVEAWAPWCHSCRSMRAFVFTDPSLTRHAREFVWLDVDTEKPVNAPLRKKFPIPALPSYLVVDPTDESVAFRWVGGATIAQFHRILDDARLMVESRGTGAAAALANAERLYGQGKDAEAAAAYREALAATPDTSSRYGRAAESLLFALQMADSNLACASFAASAFPRVRHLPSAGNVAASGLGCAVAMPADHPERAALLAALEADVREVLADPRLDLSGDDRSGVYISLLDARQSAGDSVGALAVAREWSAFLDREAERARTPDARAVYDSHRLSAYLEIGAPERAIPMLEASEKALPNDYNPPARQAIAYKAMKKWKEALAASDRALAKAYGPRKLGILQTRAEIYDGLGDAPAARRTLEEALASAEAMPPGQRSENTISSLRKKLKLTAQQ